MSAKVNMTIHLEPELKKQLIDMAKKEERTMSSFMRTIIKHYFATKDCKIEIFNNYNNITSNNYKEELSIDSYEDVDKEDDDEQKVSIKIEKVSEKSKSKPKALVSDF